uniref:Tax1-binding protein 3 n=1 Tax=Oryzias latipes TaxID=8090 RepID=A0A3P9J7A5_ORYLA
MSFVPGQPVTAVVERIEIQKLSQGPNLVLGFCIGGGIDQDPGQNPFSDDKADKGIYVTRVSPGGPADVAGLKIGDKIMQVNGWDMTVVTHDQARKKLTKKNEHVVRLLVTRKTLEEAVKQSMSRPGPSPAPSPFGTTDTTALRPLGGDGAKPQSDQTLFQFCSTGEKWDERKMSFN